MKHPCLQCGKPTKMHMRYCSPVCRRASWGETIKGTGRSGFQIAQAVGRAMRGG